MTIPTLIKSLPTKILFGLFLATLFYAINPLGVSDVANKTLFVSILMISWWIAEALPMPVVGLVPLILFPLLGILQIEKTAEAYANPIIFLFLGGFMLGLAIEKWNLHRRIALSIVKMTGSSGFELCMIRAQKYTRDLYPCYQVFSECYPERKEEMFEALNLAIFPTDNKEKINSILANLGIFLIEKSKFSLT